MSAHTPEPWHQGRTLETATTKRWSDAQRKTNEAIEQQHIFAFFSIQDEGKSRRCVAKVNIQNTDWNANAARIVACVNSCAGLNPAAYRECVEAMQKAIRMIPEQRAVLERALRHAEQTT